MKKLYQGKEVDFVPNILPVSDLRNYNEVPCLLPNTSSK